MSVIVVGLLRTPFSVDVPPTSRADVVKYTYRRDDYNCTKYETHIYAYYV